MNMGRLLLLLGASLLLATAAIHALGYAMVSSWLEGDRGEILKVAWFTFSIDWAVVALIWAYCGWRDDRRLRPVIWAAAIIPAASAIGLVATVGPAFFGVWMLVGAVTLTLTGASRLSAPPG